ncbi:VOC family protein [Paenibacillus sp. FSL P4-0338]|uniref:VOC family protein n=1 Tax=unclassified Paenibacillus TaxID=185978 RepID=UPI0003E24F52|nr:VOC family protein [Paenibacillus sp. FSL R7-269]ETT30113.1 phnB protein [Paenibacillus sp. FSL R7-269]
MITPFIHFPGKCVEAIQLYERAFKVTDKQVMLFQEAPDNSGMTITSEMSNLVMHSTLTICGTMFNMSDTVDTHDAGNMLGFNVRMDSEAEFYKAFDVLSKEGEVLQEIGPQFFSKLYTVLVDPFGIRWQIILV